MRRSVFGLVGVVVAVVSVGVGSAGAASSAVNGPIAFAGDQTGRFEIYRMRQNGTHVRRLTHTVAGKDSIFSDWSADGRWIAFDSDRSGNVELFVMNRNGGQLAAGHPQRAVQRRPVVLAGRLAAGVRARPQRGVLLQHLLHSIGRHRATEADALHTGDVRV